MDEEAPATKSKTKVKKKLKKKEDVGEHSLSLPYLSEEIIFQVLTRVPATYLHDKFRYICKPWHNLISSTGFIAQNSQQNKCELLVLLPRTIEKLGYELKLLEMDDQTLDFNLINVPLPGTREIIRSSCNGLILVNDPKQFRMLCVVNMLTKSSLTLPQCLTYCPHENCGAGLGFDPSTKEYKVVHMYADGFGFEIFTLGCSDNAWKRISGPFKSSTEPPFFTHSFQWSDPVSINGQVFHWYVESEMYIVSLDIGDEIPRKTFLPGHHKRYKYRFEFLEMGGKLALLYYVSSAQIDVWILEDFPEQNWIKTHSIMAEETKYKINSYLPDFSKLFAVAALRYGEVLIFRYMNNNYTSVHSYLYDIRKKELKKKKNVIIKEGSKFIHHRSSLIQWTNEGEVMAKRLASLTCPLVITVL
ncbi:F-box domain containing protein [Melia azedarach]|uniref:F-box domain containing protein n=1 Tax=Melia azedarach TaxID=155640 RepID=A0ACC1X0U7_MELAZ|nr:F-box domain containing protein [Melia azedarach]